jgi:hypothetical protein
MHVTGYVCCRILQLLLELQWPTAANLAHPNPDLYPSTAHATQHQHHTQPAAYTATAAAAVSCFLSILHQLVSTYPAAARLCAGALAQSQELGAALCAGLSCPLEIVLTPLLQ